MKKIIPKRNYFIIIGLIITILCACLACYNLYHIFEETNLEESPLAVKKVLINDLNNSIKDMDADTLLFISYTKNKKIHQMEKKIFNYLDEELLLDNILYLDVTEEYYSDMSKNNSEIINLVNSKLNLKKKYKITELPAVIYYSEGKAIYSADSSKKIINVNTIKKIVNNYMVGEE